MIERIAGSYSSGYRRSIRIEYFTSNLKLHPSNFAWLPFAPGLWRGRRGGGDEGDCALGCLAVS
jgi:hypothetical protein